MKNNGDQNQDKLLELVKKIRAVEKNPPDAGELTGIRKEDMPEEFKDFVAQERMIHGPEFSFEEITGIDQKSLPEPGELDEAQTSFLYTELLRLLRACSYEPDFPNGLPVFYKYREIRKMWKTKTQYLGPGIGGAFHLEFCSYEPQNCPFPEMYCTCKSFQDPDDETGDDEDEDVDDIF